MLYPSIFPPTLLTIGQNAVVILQTQSWPLDTKLRPACNPGPEMGNNTQYCINSERAKLKQNVAKIHIFAVHQMNHSFQPSIAHLFSNNSNF